MSLMRWTVTVVSVAMCATVSIASSGQAESGVGAAGPRGGLDFDNDGYDDLAIGSPNKDVQCCNGEEDDGTLNIVYGASSGLTVARNHWWADPYTHNYGRPLAGGDFDGDGFDDLATRGATSGGWPQGVEVAYGTAGGLARTHEIWHRGIPGINGRQLERWKTFGSAIATGDFDADGFDDLAVGVPFDDVNGIENAGSVHIIYGTSDGLAALDDQIWHRDRGGINATPAAKDRFGDTLTTGDFDGDGFDDLAVGVRLDDINGIENAGSVHIIYGTTHGLARFDDQIWHRDRGGINGTPAADDRFGDTLTTGDFDGDGFDDLAVGVRLDDINGIENAGSVHIIYGTTHGLARFDDQIWHRARGYVNGTPRPKDLLGGSLAAGDLDSDGFDDLVIGVPFDDVNDMENVGTVQTMHGSADGLSPVGDRIWHAVEFGAEPEEVTYSWGKRSAGEFGSSVAVGDYDGDDVLDFAAGMPTLLVVPHKVYGAVAVAYGPWTDTDEPDGQLWSLGTEGMNGATLQHGDWGWGEILAG